MKRLSIFFLCLLVFGAFFMSAQEIKVVKVNVQVANIRSQPDMNSPTIGKVTQGTLLESSGQSGNWLKVTIADASGDPITGYIHSSIVTSADSQQQSAPARKERMEQAPRQNYETPRRQQVRLGTMRLMGGLSLTNVNMSEDIPPELTKKSRTAFTGGLSLALSSSQTTLEIGVFYSPGGCILKAAVEGETAEIQVTGTGITVPVILKLGLSPSPGPYILIGGGVGYVLSQTVKLVAEGETQEEDISEDINRLYYGVVAGAGIEFQAGTMIVFVEGRFNYGFSNMIKEPAEGEYVRAYSIDIMAGVRL